MFKLVESTDELKQFNGLWKNAFHKVKYETDELNGSAHRFLIFNQKKQAAGTIEIVPYNPNSNLTTVEDMFSFSKDERIKQTPFSRVFELDKLCVDKKNKDATVLMNIILCLGMFALSNHVKYFIALINPKLLKSVKNRYGLPAEPIDDLIKTEDYSIQPMIIDMEQTLFEPEKWDKQGLVENLLESINK